MKQVSRYQDEVDAIKAEEKFFDLIDDKNSPLIKKSNRHYGEGGASTLCYQYGKLVGITSRIRDMSNWTVLVCVDLRIKTNKIF